MKLHFLDDIFCICKLADASQLHLSGTPYFLARTDTEVSFVCPASAVPSNALEVDNGWKCFYVAEELDLSMVGILSAISTIMAEAEVPLLAMSTFDTDYILIKRDNVARARQALEEGGYSFV